MEQFPKPTGLGKRILPALVPAFSAAWAVQFHYGAAAADRGQGIIDLILTCALYVLFRYILSLKIQRSVLKRAAILSAVFVLLTAVGADWFFQMRYESFSDVTLYILYYINAFIGTFILYFFGIQYALHLLLRADPIKTGVATRVSSGKAFWFTFLGCFCIYFIFLLNQYPGSMESDHMRQLKHLMDGIFENQNPLVNSLLVWGCVKVVGLFGGSMNAGVFLYSIVQLSLLSAAFGYGVCLLARGGFPRWILIGSGVFFALVPYNIFYSYGMWKDTFFAICLLFTILKMWSILQRQQEGMPVSKIHWALFFAVALLCSLSRNSGWSALLVLGLTIPFLLRKNPVKWPMTCCLIGGVALALVLQGPVFTALGVVPTADSVTVSCVPLQQVGNVIFEEKTLSQEETRLLDAVVDMQTVRDNFDPLCADPMKAAIYPKMDVLDANGTAYLKLWVTLGLKYPLTYLRAYKNLMRMYYDPNVSSEVAYKWIYQNDFGVYRSPKLLPSVDFGYYETVLELPIVNLLKRPGAILWAMLILWQVYGLLGNKRARIFCIPLLAVFGGLFLTAPVALFRYVYCAAACLPLLFCWPYVKLRE